MPPRTRIFITRSTSFLPVHRLDANAALATQVFVCQVNSATPFDAMLAYVRHCFLPVSRSLGVDQNATNAGYYLLSTYTFAIINILSIVFITWSICLCLSNKPSHLPLPNSARAQV